MRRLIIFVILLLGLTSPDIRAGSLKVLFTGNADDFSASVVSKFSTAHPEIKVNLCYKRIQLIRRY